MLIYTPKIRVNWSGWHVSHITDLHIDHEEPVFRRVFPFEKESQTYDRKMRNGSLNVI